MRSYLVTLLFILVPHLACAQEPAKIDPFSLELRFADGSAVRMVMLEPAFDVTTRFGKLTVPWADVRKIEFGLRYPDGMLHEIETAIAQLGGPDFKLREESQAKLVRHGEWAYPLVIKASQDGNPEVQRRARAILDQMREKISVEKLAIKPHDTIETSDFPIHGRIEAISFKARNPILGETTVKLSQLRTLRSLP